MRKGYQFWEAFFKHLKEKYPNLRLNQDYIDFERTWFSPRGGGIIDELNKLEAIKTLVKEVDEDPFMGKYTTLHNEIIRILEGEA